jgi:hypothetical protein
MEPFARGMLGEVRRLAAESGRTRTRDLLVVTLDHRNHGQRLKVKNTNLAYDKNPHHFVDMAALVCECGCESAEAGRVAGCLRGGKRTRGCSSRLRVTGFKAIEGTQPPS